jgi:hypothetical protein
MQFGCIRIYRNRVALLRQLQTGRSALCKDGFFMSSPSHFFSAPVRSVLAWPAWLRVLVVLPAVVLLWLAVAWANLDAAPW